MPFNPYINVAICLQKKKERKKKEKKKFVSEA
jgi:hypothetical protein